MNNEDKTEEEIQDLLRGTPGFLLMTSLLESRMAGDGDFEKTILSLTNHCDAVAVRLIALYRTISTLYEVDDLLNILGDWVADAESDRLRSLRSLLVAAIISNEFGYNTTVLVIQTIDSIFHGEIFVNETVDLGVTLLKNSPLNIVELRNAILSTLSG